jgi:hypothetical protein
MNCSEMLMKGAAKNGCKVICKLGFQHEMYTDVANAVTKHKGKKHSREDKTDGGETIQHVSHRMLVQSSPSASLYRSQGSQIMTLQPPGKFVLQ